MKTPNTIAKLLVSAFAALAMIMPVAQPASAAPNAKLASHSVLHAAPAAAAATPKATKALPMRDSKGRFMKKPSPSASKKPGPARDAKGRFIKSDKPAKGAKTLKGTKGMKPAATPAPKKK